MKRLYIIIGLWIFMIGYKPVFSSPLEKNLIYDNFQYPEEDDDTYSQIPVTELPEAVKEAIKLAYPEHKMEAAYIKIDGNYRVTIKKEDERRFRVYYTPGGAFIRSAI